MGHDPSVTGRGTPAAGDGADRAARMPVTPKGRAMRARLIDAAVARFAEVGYHATSVADITAAVGTAHGNFYRYFDDVESVLLAAVEPVLEHLVSRTVAPGPQEATDLEAVVRWQTSFLLGYAPDRVLLATMREAAAMDRTGRFTPAWRRLRQRFVHGTQEWIVEVERRLGPDPDGATPSQLAEVLGAMTEQTAYVHIGLAPATPSAAVMGRLGRTLGLSLHRVVVAPRRS